MACIWASAVAYGDTIRSRMWGCSSVSGHIWASVSLLLAWPLSLQNAEKICYAYWLNLSPWINGKMFSWYGLAMCRFVHPYPIGPCRFNLAYTVICDEADSTSTTIQLKTSLCGDKREHVFLCQCLSFHNWSIVFQAVGKTVAHMYLC